MAEDPLASRLDALEEQLSLLEASVVTEQLSLLEASVLSHSDDRTDRGHETMNSPTRRMIPWVSAVTSDSDTGRTVPAVLDSDAIPSPEVEEEQQAAQDHPSQTRSFVDHNHCAPHVLEPSDLTSAYAPLLASASSNARPTLPWPRSPRPERIFDAAPPSRAAGKPSGLSPATGGASLSCAGGGRKVLSSASRGQPFVFSPEGEDLNNISPLQQAHESPQKKTVREYFLDSPYGGGEEPTASSDAPVFSFSHAPLPTVPASYRVTLLPQSDDNGSPITLGLRLVSDKLSSPRPSWFLRSGASKPILKIWRVAEIVPDSIADRWNFSSHSHKKLISAGDRVLRVNGKANIGREFKRLRQSVSYKCRGSGHRRTLCTNLSRAMLRAYVGGGHESLGGKGGRGGPGDYGLGFFVLRRFILREMFGTYFQWEGAHDITVIGEFYRRIQVVKNFPW